MSWPESVDELLRQQEALASAEPPEWCPPAEPFTIAGCFVCSPRRSSGPGAEGDPLWASAALIRGAGEVCTACCRGIAGARYRAGLLALREGPLLETVVRRLPALPEVLLVNATGLDHPRRAGLALHLGAALGIATVGVTDRPLLATAAEPQPSRGARSPLVIGEEVVGFSLRTRTGRRPLAVHAAWRTRPQVAAEVVLLASGERARTPEPIRIARQIARRARAGVEPTPTS